LLHVLLWVLHPGPVIFFCHLVVLVDDGVIIKSEREELHLIVEGPAIIRIALSKRNSRLFVIFSNADFSFPLRVNEINRPQELHLCPRWPLPINVFVFGQSIASLYIVPEGRFPLAALLITVVVPSLSPSNLIDRFKDCPWAQAMLLVYL
jgi:hypothetical protein